MRTDAPAPTHLDDALELAAIIEPTWASREEVARDAVHGLVAMAEEGEAESGGEDQPTPSPEAPAEDQPGGEEESFTDAYNPDDLPPEVRPVYENAYKRMQADYTKKRMSDSEKVQQAQEAQEVVEALQDPERGPIIAKALGIPVADDALGFSDDDEFFADDPNARIDALQAELAQRDEYAMSQQAIQADNEAVTQQIAKLQDDLDEDFTEDEIGLLYMYAAEYRTPDGTPNVDAAYKVLEGITAQAQQRLIKSKSRAPRKPGSGTSAEQKVDLSNPDQRAKRMEEAVQYARASVA